MTHATCPRCGAEHCPLTRDGRIWCPVCERRRQQARQSGVGAYCMAVRFAFKKRLDEIVSEVP